MSIAKRIREAVERYAEGDFEASLVPMSIALDATATKVYSRRGKSSYKRFIQENMVLITKIASGGPSVENFYFGYNHPEIEPDYQGRVSIQAILYHVVRCSLLHSAS